MKLYSVGVRGGLKKINKADFQENEVYLIDDSKTMYLWFGSNITKKRRNLSLDKTKLRNEKNENAANIQIIIQNKEYGAFLAIKDALMKGEIKKQNLERRPELEIKFEETLELIEAGISPDLEAEITLAAHKLSKKNISYKNLCQLLAEMQMDLIKGPNKATKSEILKKTQEIFESSSTYEEICWLIAQLNVIADKSSIDS
ncbi:MAG: hypothetical protein HWN79_11280 [Candidatus Lokiarchaeota archaeon]|nr:hypothetical protein [Candidatus Lokiarchaeota archaeon]